MAAKITRWRQLAEETSILFELETSVWLTESWTDGRYGVTFGSKIKFKFINKFKQI